MRGQRHAPAAFYPRERPSTHYTGGGVGPRAGLDTCGKSGPHPGFDPPTVQPVASRYTNWATGSTGAFKYWQKYIFYFKKLCTIYKIDFNNIYIIITHTCFDTFVPFSGSFKVVLRLVTLATVTRRHVMYSDNHHSSVLTTPAHRQHQHRVSPTYSIIQTLCLYFINP
jgi:hypothetical protein